MTPFDSAATPQAIAPSSSEIRALARLKFGLITRGVRIDPGAESLMSEGKTPIRTRSGVSGGLDLVLPHGVNVIAAHAEPHVAESPFMLRNHDSRLALYEHDMWAGDVSLVPRPAFYRQRLEDGSPVNSVGQLCSPDRLCIGMTRHCVFWKKERRCTYCTIGANVVAEHREKTVANIVEAVRIAVADPIQPARHILIGGGTPNDEDRGAAFAMEVSAAIKAVIDVPIYVMITPPSDLDDIPRLHDAGVDELGMNVEFFSREALERHTPGKLALVGIDHHYRALERAVDVFGPVNTRSIAIVGIEPADATIAGAARLAEMGVMPILSPFQPLAGSMLATERGFTPEQYVDVWERARDVVERHGMPLGPTCRCCQNNVLAMPFGTQYRTY